MVSKASATYGSAQAIDYILNDKGKAVEIDRNLLAGEDGKEIISEFREVQAMNTNCVKNTYSIFLSPSQEKGISNQEFIDFGRAHLKNLGLENNQYIMAVHRSTQTPHIHIIVNRISLNGSAHNDQFISKKAQESAEIIAKKYGLITAKEIKMIKDLSLKAIKNEISEVHKFAKMKSKNFDQYKDYMYSKGVIVEPTINLNNELQGYKLVHKESDIKFKASQINKKVGLKDLIEKGIFIDLKMSKPLEEIKENIRIKNLEKNEKEMIERQREREEEKKIEQEESRARSRGYRR